MSDSSGANQVHQHHLGCIRWEQQGPIARVQLSTPGHLNAISIAMWQQLKDCFSEIAAVSDLRVAVITGEGGAFASGADISEFKTSRTTRDQVRHYHESVIAPALRAIVHCPIPVVAAIDGPCVGGGLEIASVCDLRIASERSRFGIPIALLGFGLAPSEAVGLVALVGQAVALEILLEGRIFESQEAYEKGLVNRVLPNASWADEIEATLSRITRGAPQAARHNKRLIRLLAAIDDHEVLSPAQREACWDFVESQDYQRGIAAFMNKTTPTFLDN